MTDRELLRHALATLAYRAAKAVRGAPASFADFQAGPTSKTPVGIVTHMGDLFDWARALAHTGQLAMLRRLHGAPIKGESYNRADIAAGRVGPDQTPAQSRHEFD